MTRVGNDVETQRPDVERNREMNDHRMARMAERLALNDLFERPAPTLSRRAFGVEKAHRLLRESLICKTNVD